MPNIARYFRPHAVRSYAVPRRPKQFRPPQWRPPEKKVADPYYSSKAWRDLRAARLAMDGHQCTVPGCTARATIVDHIITRRAGGTDTLSNLRSLCRAHDQQIKERSDGSRANGGRFRVNDLDRWRR
jgi:5-methylcytosine-specific restriction endonuclease McrA